MSSHLLIGVLIMATCFACGIVGASAAIIAQHVGRTYAYVTAGRRVIILGNRTAALRAIASDIVSERRAS